jgi:hypothetical protein
MPRHVRQKRLSRRLLIAVDQEIPPLAPPAPDHAELDTREPLLSPAKPPKQRNAGQQEFTPGQAGSMNTRI